MITTKIVELNFHSKTRSGQGDKGSQFGHRSLEIMKASFSAFLAQIHLGVCQ